MAFNNSTSSRPVKRRIRGKRQIIKPPSYELKEFVDKGSQKKRLVIFTSAERNMCYIYNFYKCENKYVCRNCNRKGKKDVRAKQLFDADGSIQLSLTSHVCDPVEYNPDEFKDIVPEIVNSPHFEEIMVNYRGKLYPRLFLFSSENLCCQYGWHPQNKYYFCGDCEKNFNKYVYANVIKNANGEKHVELCEKDHRCQGRRYRRDENNELYLILPHSLREVRIDRSPEESPVSSSSNGLLVNQIPRNPVPASKPASSSNNNSIVPVPQIPIKVEEDNEDDEATEDEPGILMDEYPMVKSARFRIETFIGDVGAETKRLVVFDNANPNLAYTYHPGDADTDTFVCNGCSALSAPQNVWAKLKRNGNGDEVLQLGPDEHACKPILREF